MKELFFIFFMCVVATGGLYGVAQASSSLEFILYASLIFVSGTFSGIAICSAIGEII